VTRLESLTGRLWAGCRCWHAGILAAVVLGVLTLFVSQASGRYRVVVPKLLGNLDFANGGAGWFVSPGGGVKLLDTTPRIVTLSARGTRRTVLLGRRLGAGDGSYDHVRIGADLRAQALVAGTAPWQRANLALVSLDARGKRLWYWPQQIAAITGTTFWHRYQRSIPLGGPAASRLLVAYVTARSGRLLIRDLTVQGVAESTTYRWLDRGLMGAWALLALWATVMLARRARRRPTRWLALLCAGLIVAAGITPQPRFRDELDLGWRVLAAARELLSAEGHSVTVASSPVPARSPSRRSPPVAGTAGRARDPRAGAERRSRSPALGTDFRWAGSDKWTHVAGFLVLALLVLIAYRQHSAIGCIVALTTLGGSIEALQALSITREPEWLDFGSDIAGILLGAAIALGLSAAMRARRPPVVSS